MTVKNGKKEDLRSEYDGGGTYKRGRDPEVTCWHCKRTFLCDCMDATCRLCHAPYDKSRCAEFKFSPVIEQKMKGQREMTTVVPYGIKPTRDKILIKPVKATDTSEGGIIIPDAFQETQKRGTVVAVGDGRRAPNGVLVKPEVKVGDFLIYSGEGFELVQDGVTYLIISSEQVTAVEKWRPDASKS